MLGAHHNQRVEAVGAVKRAHVKAPHDSIASGWAHIGMERGDAHRNEMPAHPDLHPAVSDELGDVLGTVYAPGELVDDNEGLVGRAIGLPYSAQLTRDSVND